MKIKLNGDIKAFKQGDKLTDLVADYLNGKEPKGIAVALNGMVIPKQKWESAAINENDEIEIVHAVQGG